VLYCQIVFIKNLMTPLAALSFEPPITKDANTGERR
jgi:hypothetical protein